MLSIYFWENGVRYFHSSTGMRHRAGNQRPSAEVRANEPGAPAVKTVNNPYYIGSVQMVGAREQGRDKNAEPRFAKATLQEALIAAQLRLAADPKLTEVSIVRIVRVVRRAAPVPPPPPAVSIEVVE